jgi:predicted dehydrogenase
MKTAALVGFGFMGMTHTLSILKINEMKLTAIVERDLSLVEKNLKSNIGNIAVGNIDAGELADARRYSEFDECLQKEELDAVIICTHVNSHYELVREALEKGKNVFVEKPFCLNIDHARELIALASRKKKLLMVGHVVRFMSPYQQLKKWIDTKEFGKLKFLYLERFCGLPGWGQWKDKDVKDLSGGALFDLVIHDIDYAASLLGPPSEIKCSYLPGEYSKHDYVSALWGYKDKNVHVRIEGGFTFHKSFPFQAGYMAQFSDASVVYSTLKGDVIQVADDSSVREVPAGDAGAGYFNEMLYFTECLVKVTEPKLCTPSSSLEAIELCYKHL